MKGLLIGGKEEDMELQTVKLPLSDEKIIALYWSRDEKAITETDVKYRNYLYSVARHIVQEQPDCEECLNDTYLAAWNAMPPTMPKIKITSTASNASPARPMATETPPKIPAPAARPRRPKGLPELLRNSS